HHRVDRIDAPDHQLGQLMGRQPSGAQQRRDLGSGKEQCVSHGTGLRPDTVSGSTPGRPKPDDPSTSHRPSFHTLVKWRTGCEGRIVHLKRRSGWDRTLLDGLAGARTWCGRGVFTHNLTTSTTRPRTSRPTGGLNSHLLLQVDVVAARTGSK